MTKFLMKNSTAHFINQRQIPAVLIINCRLPLSMVTSKSDVLNKMENIKILQVGSGKKARN